MILQKKSFPVLEVAIVVANVHHRDYHCIRDPIIGARRVVSDSHVIGSRMQ